MPPRPSALVALLVVLLGGVADAQERADSTGARPFVRVHGQVSARALLHRTRPAVEVRFRGDVADTLRVAERDNLPRPVVPGQMYRDVRVRFEVRSALDPAVLDRLLAPADSTGTRPPEP